jgi:hypothetical protein
MVFHSFLHSHTISDLRQFKDPEQQDSSEPNYFPSLRTSKRSSMQNEKPVISPFLYYLLLSSLTNLPFILTGLILLSCFYLSIMNSIGIIILVIFLMLYKTVIPSFVSSRMYKKTDKREFLVKFIGLNLGGFYGMFIGGFLGLELAGLLKFPGILGLIVGALVFYFAGRWIGPIMSSWFGLQVDKVVAIKEIPAARRVTRPKIFLPLLYVIIAPWLWVGIAILLNHFHIEFISYDKGLPIARIVAILLSIFSLCAPWLIKKQGLKRLQEITFSLETAMLWLGVTFSIIPSIFGFMLFTTVGASILEMCFFSMASSLGGIFWIVSQTTYNENFTPPGNSKATE